MGISPRHGSHAALPIACDALNARTVAVRKYHCIFCVSSPASRYTCFPARCWSLGCPGGDNLTRIASWRTHRMARRNFWKAHCFINSLRLGSTFSPPFSLESWWCFPLFAGQYCLLKKTPKIFGFFSKNFLSSKIRLSEKPGQTYRYCKRYSDE